MKFDDTQPQYAAVLESDQAGSAPSGVFQSGR
jgi:hypothetical protein